jgi:type IV pilus assembly protein PilQ
MRHLFARWLCTRRLAAVALGVLVSASVGMPSGATAQSPEPAKFKNQLLSISVDKDGALPTVHLKTREPVGYRYTVYDSFNPVRVVIDFPDMDVSAVTSPIKVDRAPLQEIRVSSFDLSAGKLGRVELLLTAETSYNVFLSADDFRVSFAQGAGPAAPAAAAKAVEAAGAKPVAKPEPPVESAPPVATQPEAPQPSAPAAASPPPSAAPPAPASSARAIVAVEVGSGRISLNADGNVERFEHFALKSPARLVVDIFGVKPSFKERTFKASGGFTQVRVGTYPDKTRFVLDSAAGALPRYSVGKEGSAVVVSWGAAAGSTAAPKANQAPAPAPKANPAPTRAAHGAPVTVTAVDFKVDNGKSILMVDLSAPGAVVAPKAEGNVVRFGIKNALISRALRRTVDASAFPSAVRLITPYTVRADGAQDVRFAVELKGTAPFSLTSEGNRLLFVVENGPFAEPTPAPVQKVEIPAPIPAPAAAERGAPGGLPFAEAPGEPAPVAEEVMAQEPKYVGQKISLVFDDADIRKILQLIAEVSELNIIASDEVKGTISLRLIDVPWDQALDLIMDIKGLGMIREGNVARILPKAQLRAAEEAQLTAARNKERLEDLVTETINVSYTNLANVSAPSKELLTERGKITEDTRNKKLIIKDIPSVVAEVRKMVAILDMPERQVMIEARIVQAQSNFVRNLGISWNLTYGADSSGPWDPSKGGISGGGNFLIDPAIGNAGLGTSLTFGRLGIDSTVLDLRLAALETSGAGKTVSTPRVATLNGQAASIKQGTKIPYQSSGADGLPKTEFAEANLELVVTPEINPDNSIILDIKATNSTPTTVEGADAPAINTREATTKLLVRDGDTTVIGGIFVEDENNSETGIPLLRRIPLLGHLFKSTTKSTNRSELLVFITPRIVSY